MFDEGRTQNIRRAVGVIKGMQNTLVILMQFDDLEFTWSNRDFQVLFNETGFSCYGQKGKVCNVAYSGYLEGRMNTIEVPAGFYIDVQGKTAVKIRVD